MTSIIASIFYWVLQLLTLIVVVDVVLSYFMSPFHPVRMKLDRFVNPILAPIRKLLPQTGGIDFSPLVLIILLQLLNSFIQRLLR